MDVHGRQKQFCLCKRTILTGCIREEETASFHRKGHRLLGRTRRLRGGSQNTKNWIPRRDLDHLVDWACAKTSQEWYGTSFSTAYEHSEVQMSRKKMQITNRKFQCIQSINQSENRSNERLNLLDVATAAAVRNGLNMEIRAFTVSFGDGRYKL